MAISLSIQNLDGTVATYHKLRQLAFEDANKSVLCTYQSYTDAAHYQSDPGQPLNCLATAAQFVFPAGSPSILDTVFNDGITTEQRIDGLVLGFAGSPLSGGTQVA